MFDLSLTTVRRRVLLTSDHSTYSVVVTERHQRVSGTPLSWRSVLTVTT
jgi:hypothetical protein